MKKEKLESIPKIHRRLYKLSLTLCREIANYTCAVCGMKKGDLYNGKPQKMDSHHLFSRHFRDCPLKFDIMNLICLCPICHKFGDKSAHKNPIWFGEWLRLNKPEIYEYVLKHCSDKVDLKNREILYEIERKLNEFKLNILNEQEQKLKS